MVDMSYAKMTVHRSLFPREMLGGVPQAGLFIIFLLALVFVYDFRIYWSAVPIALLYFVMRHLTKNDPWFIEMGLNYITQKEKLIP